jgi:hypothetical protein
MPKDLWTWVGNQGFTVIGITTVDAVRMLQAATKPWTTLAAFRRSMLENTFHGLLEDVLLDVLQMAPDATMPLSAASPVPVMWDAYKVPSKWRRGYFTTGIGMQRRLHPHGHVVEMMPKSNRCVACKAVDNKKTRYTCAFCKVFLCMSRGCFKRFHSAAWPESSAGSGGGGGADEAADAGAGDAGASGNAIRGGGGAVGAAADAAAVAVVVATPLPRRRRGAPLNGGDEARARALAPAARSAHLGAAAAAPSVDDDCAFDGTFN